METNGHPIRLATSFTEDELAHCWMCRSYHPVSEFGVSNSSPSGRQGHCRTANRIYMAGYTAGRRREATQQKPVTNEAA